MAFTFDPDTGRYRDATGKLVSQKAVRNALDEVLRVQAGEAKALTQQLADGQLSLGDWQRLMMQNVKSSHLIATSVAHGGWGQLSQADFGWVGQRIRTQYDFLRGFAADIATGRQPLTGAGNRATLYAEAARTTHRAAEQRMAVQRGEEQERNVLGAADHCKGCLTATSRGWVPLGSLPRPGLRDCKVRCHCYLQYRVEPA